MLNGNKKIKVALIGFGLSARYLQAPFFIHNQAFELRAVVTSQEIPINGFKNIIRKSSIDEVLNDKEIDLVSICSPNATHYSYAKKALEAGKHVLLEKPMASTAKEARELIEISKKEGKVLAVFITADLIATF